MNDNDLNEIVKNCPIQKILIDMDGVLVNYDKRTDELGFRKPDTRKTDWDKARNMGEKFWSEMEWMPNGEELYKSLYAVAKGFNRKIGILSSIFIPDGKVGKYNWLKKNIPNLEIGDIYLNDRGLLKYEILPDDCILIDDNEENVNNCLKNNKYAILYKGDISLVISDLLNMICNIYEKNKNK